MKWISDPWFLVRCIRGYCCLLPAFLLLYVFCLKAERNGKVRWDITYSFPRTTVNECDIYREKIKVLEFCWIVFIHKFYLSFLMSKVNTRGHQYFMKAVLLHFYTQQSQQTHQTENQLEFLNSSNWSYHVLSRLLGREVISMTSSQCYWTYLRTAVEALWFCLPSLHLLSKTHQTSSQYGKLKTTDLLKPTDLSWWPVTSMEAKEVIPSSLCIFTISCTVFQKRTWRLKQADWDANLKNQTVCLMRSMIWQSLQHLSHATLPTCNRKQNCMTEAYRRNVAA